MGLCISKQSQVVVSRPPASDGQAPSRTLVLRPRPADFMQTGRRAHRIYLPNDFEHSMRQTSARTVPQSISLNNLNTSETDSTFADSTLESDSYTSASDYSSLSSASAGADVVKRSSLAIDG